MSRVSNALALLASVCAALAISAQDAPQPPRIRVSTRLAQVGVIVRDKNTMTAMVSIARHVADIPGRKNLVWLTADVPLSGAAIAGTMSRPDIAVYPVDARGLLPVATPRSDEDSARFAQLIVHASPYSANMPSLSTTSQPPGIEAMLDIADKTGGRAFTNTNDITGAIRQAVEDSAVPYRLGFYIDRASADGKFHELKVK